MAHFANIDENNVVTQVLYVLNEDAPDEETGIAFCNSIIKGNWVQTSYNNNFRVRYAGIGFTYDKDRDAFIPPKPFPSWVLDEKELNWEPPIPRPEGLSRWDEETLSWVPVPLPPDPVE